jgi:hypothetical protein
MLGCHAEGNTTLNNSGVLSQLLKVLTQGALITDGINHGIGPVDFMKR